jgi:EsV-1-7 cysteine-rich motif
MEFIKCNKNDCKRKATTNYKGSPPLVCGFHKENGMVNVNQLCNKCYNKHPVFNLEGLKAEYCKDCKTDNMTNVKDPKCVKCNKVQPIYNKQGLKALYCEKCKDDDMIDVNNQKCIMCKITRPTFNKPGLKAEYCEKCKDDDMIDVNHEKCIKCNEIRPTFNKPGLSAKYCEKCKDDDMIDVKNKMCIKCNKVQPNFNKLGLKAEYCDGCKDDNMIDVKHKKCIECKEIRINNSKYNDHCLRCFIYKFPDNQISKNYKVKEKHIQDFIEEEFPEMFNFDKRIDGGCSRKRPDAFKDCLTHVLIIEVDEYQHRNYEEICENKRMMEIFGDTNYRPIIFIRFNPDEYIDEDNNKIESSFKMHKTRNVPIIRDPIEWQDRLVKLKQTIKHYIKDIPVKTITIKKLFYDYV